MSATFGLRRLTHQSMDKTTGSHNRQSTVPHLHLTRIFFPRRSLRTTSIICVHALLNSRTAVSTDYERISTRLTRITKT